MDGGDDRGRSRVEITGERYPGSSDGEVSPGSYWHGGARSNILALISPHAAGDRCRLEDIEGVSQSRDELAVAVITAFNEQERAAVLEELDCYGIEPHERERTRVQCAIVELSGGNRAKLSMYIDMAKLDYRDVLACQQLAPSSATEGQALQAAARALIDQWGDASMRVGVQGELGSACDGAAVSMLGGRAPTFVYLTDADQTLAALDRGEIDAAVLAVESPLGVPVQETALALARYRNIAEVDQLQCEVRHCLLTRVDSSARITAIASHAIPLAKHREFLSTRFPGYRAIEVADTGLAAKQLATGELPDTVAVIAMPRAAAAFGLNVLEAELPANDRYLTRFVLVQKNDRAP